MTFFQILTDYTPLITGLLSNIGMLDTINDGLFIKYYHVIYHHGLIIYQILTSYIIVRELHNLEIIKIRFLACVRIYFVQVLCLPIPTSRKLIKSSVCSGCRWSIRKKQSIILQNSPQLSLCPTVGKTVTFRLESLIN